MLTEIYLENFKCHKKISLKDLRPLSIITGPNNSGKSAILQAIAFLRDWQSSKAQELVSALNYLHSFRDTIYQKAVNNRIKIGLGIKCDPFTKDQIEIFKQNGINLITYDKNPSQIVWDFSFDHNFDVNQAPQRISFDKEIGVILGDNELLSKIDTDIPKIEGDFSKPFVADHIKPLKARGLFNIISRRFKNQLKTVFYILPKRGIEQWNSSLKWQSDEIWGNGANIVTFLTYLFNERSHLFGEIESWVKKFDPSIDSLKTPLIKEHIEEGYEETEEIFSLLEINEQNVHKHLLTFGSGLIAIFPIIVQLVVCEPGSVVFIEEPEIHLHQGAIQVLLDLFVESIKKGKQIILTTHSIDLLLSVHKAFTKDPELKNLVVRYDITREEETRQTKATRIEPSDDYKVWSQGFKSILKTRPS